MIWYSQHFETAHNAMIWTAIFILLLMAKSSGKKIPTKQWLSTKYLLYIFLNK